MTGRSSFTSIRLFVTVGLAILVALAFGISVGLGAAADDPSLSISLPDEVEVGEREAGEVLFTDVEDPDGVGSFAIELEFDPDAVSLEASETSSFSLETDTEAGTLRLVGYTSDLPGPDGDVSLLSLEVSGEEGGESTTIEPTVESLTTADGDDLPHSTSAHAVSVTGEGAAGNGNGNGNGGGGGGGGGVAPSTDDSTDEEHTDTDTDDETPADDSATDDDLPADTDSTDRLEDDGDDEVPGFGFTVGIGALLITSLAVSMRYRKNESMTEKPL